MCLGGQEDWEDFTGTTCASSPSSGCPVSSAAAPGFPSLLGFIFRRLPHTWLPQPLFFLFPPVLEGAQGRHRSCPIPAVALSWEIQVILCQILYFEFLAFLGIGNPQEGAMDGENERLPECPRKWKAADSRHWMPGTASQSTFVPWQNTAWGLIWCRETTPAASNFLTRSPSV